MAIYSQELFFFIPIKLAEKSKQVEHLSQQTLDAENEVQVLKRKHASSLRELTRELQTAMSASNKQQMGGLNNIPMENNNQRLLPVSTGDNHGKTRLLFG